MIEPGAGRWGALVGAHWRGRDRALSERFRTELSLPIDRPVVMSGHQAEVWHPGILAKWLAMSAGAAALGAAAVWLVVDQDDNDPFRIRYPVSRAGGHIDECVWPRREETPEQAVLTGTPVALRPPLRAGVGSAGETPDGGGEEAEERCEPALPSVGAGMERIRTALAAHADEESAAKQVAAATVGLLQSHTGRPRILYATDLSRTTLFAELVERMRADPRGCADAYNRAIAVTPGSEHTGVAMLASADRRRGPELPLWRLRRAGPGGRAVRERIHADTLAESSLDDLAPRALMMTAMLRLAGCDLFIHGTGGGGIGGEEEGRGGGGGGGYDRIMERWLREWLGAEFDAARLAPVATVTATLRLPFPPEAVDAETVARAVWFAHHARHDPALLDDPSAAAEKRQFVARIAALRAEGQHPRAEFDRMHALLEEARSRHAARLARLDAAAADARARLAEQRLTQDRTWAFALYPETQVAALQERINAAFVSGGGAAPRAEDGSHGT